MQVASGVDADESVRIGRAQTHEKGSEEFFKCEAFCGQTKARSAFNQSQWQNRLKRSATCNECMNAKRRFKCVQCKAILGQSSYSRSQWKHRFDISRRTLCKTCEAVGLQYECEGECRRLLSSLMFSESVWRNRYGEKRRTICIDCKPDLHATKQMRLATASVDSAASSASSLQSNFHDVRQHENKREQNGLQNLVLAALNGTDE